MTSWDFVLDPVMVKQEHWVWDTVGQYFGIPLQNFWGWWLTSFLILVIYQWVISRLERGEYSHPSQHEWMSVLIYITIGFGNIAGAAITGLWGPALIAGSAMVFWSVAAWISAMNL